MLVLVLLLIGSDLFIKTNSRVLLKTKMQCAIPENIHTFRHPMDGHWKFQGGGGFQGAKVL